MPAATAAFGWQILKAQCYQESLLQPSAVSAAGAKGLCQFMDATWSDMSERLGMSPGASAFAPKLSIQAAAYYMGRLRAQWSSPRPEADRHSLALASYNAGLGSLLRAQRVCEGLTLYADVVRCLPAVTGAANAGQTTAYVSRIWGFWREMVLGL